jgi:hypothetical protein
LPDFSFLEFSRFRDFIERRRTILGNRLRALLQ